MLLLNQIICYNTVLAFKFLNKIYNLIMSTSREVPLIISQLIATFLGLVKKAAYNTYNKTISVKEKLVKLNFISSCKDMHNKFKRSYLDKVSKAYYL
jgi:hypothetical protein